MDNQVRQCTCSDFLRHCLFGTDFQCATSDGSSRLITSGKSSAATLLHAPAKLSFCGIGQAACPICPRLVSTSICKSGGGMHVDSPLAYQLQVPLVQPSFFSVSCTNQQLVTVVKQCKMRTPSKPHVSLLMPMRLPVLCKYIL